DPLPVNSQWKGRFQFRPPSEGYTSDVQLDVTRREGASFEGVYTTESGKYQWVVKGSLDNESIDWGFTGLIRERTPTGVVGHAHVTGNLHDARMDVVFRDQNSVADMMLKRVK